jgi:hypothetical protein
MRLLTLRHFGSIVADEISPTRLENARFARPENEQSAKSAHLDFHFA